MWKIWSPFRKSPALMSTMIQRRIWTESGACRAVGILEKGLTQGEVLETIGVA